MIEQFKTSDDYTFHVRKYPAEGQPRGHLVMLHGIRSHSGWYDRSCQQFAKAGYEVHFLDRRGSGLNTAQRGDCPGFRRLIRDVEEYVEALRKTQPKLPVFLAGISWGGKTILGVDIRKPGLVNGVAMICPGLKASVSPPFIKRIRILLASIFRPTKNFEIPLNAPELFTANPEAQAFIRDDSLGLHEATARFLANSFRLDLWLKRNFQHVTTNVLLMLAEHDRVIDNAKTRQVFKKLRNAKSAEVIEYTGSQHTLEFEGDNHPFVRDLIAWMERHT